MLSPTPSDDVNDPLNWSKGRKLLALICVVSPSGRSSARAAVAPTKRAAADTHVALSPSLPPPLLEFVYVGVNGFTTCLIYSLYEAIQQDTGISIATLNAGSGYLFLFLGCARTALVPPRTSADPSPDPRSLSLGGLVTLPVASVFGNRMVYLFSTLVVVACAVWTPHIRSDGAWYGMRIIAGLFFSPVESLAEVSISQIVFAHERGYWMGVYTLVLFGCVRLSLALLPSVPRGLTLPTTLSSGATTLRPSSPASSTSRSAGRGRCTSAP